MERDFSSTTPDESIEHALARLQACHCKTLPVLRGRELVGLLTTDIKYESLRTVFLISTDIDFERLNGEFANMRANLEEQFRADGLRSADITFRRSADVGCDRSLGH